MSEIELSVVRITVEIDVVFLEEITNREEVNGEEDGSEERALRNIRGEGK